MRTKTWLAVVVLAWLAAEADAHFVLVSPAPSIVQNRLGDPQKVAPCGGVSANPGRGTPANPGVPSGVVTDIKGGSSFHVLLSETVFHPGHYRVALAKSAANLPPDPKVTTRDSDRGPWSVSAEIQSPALPPLLADGLFAHTERPTGLVEADITIPNVNCRNCILQVIQFMADHGKNPDGDFSYHHCATVNITADAAKPIDAAWSSALR
ncbi:MAG TPA: SCE4755 family polysaccharide monooxygenase-like protein [Vicinamibacterales bacterium]|jgi:hypothetical protein|nr:SCE4755 family polysaccharide monooxygenase-like protein [Vicinamibacterales bacterium]